MNLVPRWFDPALVAWASWVRDNARWQGWGGGVDRINEANHGGKRSPGTHSDPVLAELMAMLGQKQGPHARLHKHVLGLPSDERKVIVARFCGRPTLQRSALDYADEKGRATFVGNWPKNKTVCLLDLVWHRGMEDEKPLEERKLMRMRDVAITVGLSVSACETALERARLRLLFRIEVEAMIRRGAFMPDGRVYTEQELEALREKTRQEQARAA